MVGAKLIGLGIRKAILDPQEGGPDWQARAFGQMIEVGERTDEQMEEG